MWKKKVTVGSDISMQDKNEIIIQIIWQLNLIFATRDIVIENVKVESYLNKKHLLWQKKIKTEIGLWHEEP